jgi:anti-sigma regulatory factor (Ser/Thr protein kinase)
VNDACTQHENAVFLLLRPADSQAPATARDRAGKVLGQWGLASLVDDAAVVVSELATNAISAGATAMTVLIANERFADRVHIAVWDDASGKPELKEPDYDAEHGRGLHLVDALAADWGCDFAQTGKIVWADLNIPPTRNESTERATSTAGPKETRRDDAHA